jgi:transcriptional regulator with XRE-family HTH domain
MNSGRAGSVDPAFFQREDVRRVLAALDIGALYRILAAEAGVSQRQIAALTGQSQPEVSEIVSSRRRVESYQLLVRIAESLGIPREFMGLSWWGPDGAYCGEARVVESPEEDEEMRRRALIAATMTATLGQAVSGLGELAVLALPPGAPVPPRLSMAHVHTVRAVTEELRRVARQFGGQAGVFGATAKSYTPWMQVPAPDAVKAGLGAALVELYTEAGWACYDCGVDGKGYFSRALELADTAGDGFGIANAAWNAGLTLVRSGHPNDALKCFQLGQLVLSGFPARQGQAAVLHPDDPRVPVLTGRLHCKSATAYVLLGDVKQAQRCLAQAQDGWAPREAFEQAGMDLSLTGIHLDLGRLDAAEAFAASAARTYDAAHLHRGRTQAELALAEVHVRTGEPRGLQLAQQAIKAVSTLQSTAVRQERLLPLATALETRPGNDAQQLARTARHLAVTRA